MANCRAKHKKPFYFCADAALLERCREKAENQGLTLTALIVKLLEKYLKEV